MIPNPTTSFSPETDLTKLSVYETLLSNINPENEDRVFSQCLMMLSTLWTNLEKNYSDNFNGEVLFRLQLRTISLLQAIVDKINDTQEKIDRYENSILAIIAIQNRLHNGIISQTLSSSISLQNTLLMRRTYDVFFQTNSKLITELYSNFYKHKMKEYINKCIVLLKTTADSNITLLNKIKIIGLFVNNIHGKSFNLTGEVLHLFFDFLTEAQAAIEKELPHKKQDRISKKLIACYIELSTTLEKINSLHTIDEEFMTHFHEKLLTNTKRAQKFSKKLIKNVDQLTSEEKYKLVYVTTVLNAKAEIDTLERERDYLGLLMLCNENLDIIAQYAKKPLSVQLQIAKAIFLTQTGNAYHYLNVPLQDTRNLLDKALKLLNNIQPGDDFNRETLKNAKLELIRQFSTLAYSFKEKEEFHVAHNIYNTLWNLLYSEDTIHFQMERRFLANEQHRNERRYAAIIKENIAVQNANELIRFEEENQRIIFSKKQTPGILHLTHKFFAIEETDDNFIINNIFNYSLKDIKFLINTALNQQASLQHKIEKANVVTEASSTTFIKAGVETNNNNNISFEADTQVPIKKNKKKAKKDKGEEKEKKSKKQLTKEMAAIEVETLKAENQFEVVDFGPEYADRVVVNFYGKHVPKGIFYAVLTEGLFADKNLNIKFKNIFLKHKTAGKVNESGFKLVKGDKHSVLNKLRFFNGKTYVTGRDENNNNNCDNNNDNNNNSISSKINSNQRVNFFKLKDPAEDPRVLYQPTVYIVKPDGQIAILYETSTDHVFLHNKMPDLSSLKISKKF